MPGPLKHSWRRICTCGPGEALLHWPRPEGRSPGISGNAAAGWGWAVPAALLAARPQPRTLPLPHP